MSLPLARLAKPGEVPGTWDKPLSWQDRLLYLRVIGHKYSRRLKMLDEENLLTWKEKTGITPHPSAMALWCRRKRRLKFLSKLD
jgi:hypothetical protein